MGWPPDFKATLTCHSISALTDSPRAVLILAWRSPRPGKRVEDTAQLTGPQGPPSSQLLQPEHGMVRQADSLSGKSRQPSPGEAEEKH